jgi:hydrogenase-4 component E
VISPDLSALVVDRTAAALIVLAIGSLMLRSLRAGIVALGVQSLLLVAIGAAVALADAEPGLWVAVAVTFVVKVLVIPFVLTRALELVRLKREVDPVLPDRLVLLGGVALVLVGYRAASGLALGGGQALAVAIGLMLVGGLMMVTRRKTLSQVIGLVTLENGLYLLALVATTGLPLAVELAVLFDLLVGAILLAILTGRISMTFDTINTDRLNALRDRPVRVRPR